jgi:hypothetical protein
MSQKYRIIFNIIYIQLLIIDIYGMKIIKLELALTVQINCI